MEIRVGTFNILNTSCRFLERKEWIFKTIREMDCDVLGVQEVNENVIFELFQQDVYDLHVVKLPCPMVKEEPEFKIDGNCFLIKKGIQVVEEKSFTFFNQLRVAQVLTLCKDGIKFVVANTHLDHLSDVTREEQLRELIGLLEMEKEKIQIVTGDFNFIPESKPYDLMIQRFRSGVKVFKGKESILTFPTGLVGEYADVNMFGCFDYVWISHGIQVKYAEVFRECGKGTVWASDHYPVFADLCIRDEGIIDNI
jgi:endonuclease/exonuclease/phosphatase family metal-dependent hydrolase